METRIKEQESAETQWSFIFGHHILLIDSSVMASKSGHRPDHMGSDKNTLYPHRNRDNDFYQSKLWMQPIHVQKEWKKVLLMVKIHMLFVFNILYTGPNKGYFLILSCSPFPMARRGLSSLHLPPPFMSALKMEHNKPSQALNFVACYTDVKYVLNGRI
jgi:hypothetical protein